MAIDNLDKLKSALPGRVYNCIKAGIPYRTGGTFSSSWTVAGFPVAGATPPSGNGEIPTRTTTGALNFVQASGSNNLYIAEISGISTANCSLIIYDRLWHNSGFSFNITASQNINTPPTLTRPDSLGDGVELWGQVYSNSGTTASTITATYTNSDGVTGRSATYAKPGSALVAGEMFPFTLVSGDRGVRTVSSVQLSAGTGTAGNFGLVLLRRIIEIPLIALTPIKRNFYYFGFRDIHPDACLTFMFLWTTSSTRNVNITLNFIEG